MQRAAASQIEMCAPIFEEVHTNIVHSECICRLLIFLGIIRGIFKSSSRARKMHQHLLKKEINKRSLTEVFGTWSSRTPKKIFSPWVLKNKFLFKNFEKVSYLSDLFDFGTSFANQGATLAPWENQAQCHGRLARHTAVWHRRADILQKRNNISESCFSTKTK